MAGERSGRDGRGPEQVDGRVARRHRGERAGRERVEERAGVPEFGVAGKIGEQRGDGVKSAMMMVPAEVVPAAGAPTRR